MIDDIIKVKVSRLEIEINFEINIHLGIKPTRGGIPPMESRFSEVIDIRFGDVINIVLNLNVDCFSIRINGRIIVIFITEYRIK